MSWRADFDWASPGGDPSADLPAAAVEAFASSMPTRYGVLFDPRAIRRHAAIAHRRGKRLAYAEVWRALGDGTAALCVVADDRPGLLSAIAAALVSHKLDVITALVFSRATGAGDLEAVDFLWVRRSISSDTAVIGADEAHSVGEVLSAILAGTISIEEIASRSAPSSPLTDPSVEVRFDPNDEEGRAILLVEAPDRPGMLLTITRELFQHGAQIARSLVRTADRRAYNRFELSEFSGQALSAERRAQIRAAVVAALAFGVDAEASPVVDAEASPVVDAEASPVVDAEASPVGNSPR
jgi:[protein-PII] uridylyltransferase